MFEKIDKLWKLWEIALEDLKKCEADPNYKIAMSIYYAKHNGLCYVCAAGAVIAQRLQPDAKVLNPWNFPEAITKRLKAINELREGNLLMAFVLLNGFSEYISNFSMPVYESPDWWHYARRLLDFLKDQDI